jgi:mRNA interferase RelE/StbE
MKILYTNSFSKDLDRIRHQAKIKKRLLELIDKIKQIGSLADLNDVRKIEGYQGYYRIRVGDYRLGIKVTENSIEMVRFLHRKEIYRRFP